VKRKTGRIRIMKYWEIIADNLSKAGWTWGCVAFMFPYSSAQLGAGITIAN
jgi:hypothetical protein